MRAMGQPCGAGMAAGMGAFSGIIARHWSVVFDMTRVRDMANLRMANNICSTFPHSSTDIGVFVLQVKSQAPSNGPPNPPTMLHALPLSAHLDTITFSLPPSRDKWLPAPLPSCMTRLGMDQDTHTSILHSSPVKENVVRLSRIYGW